MFYGQASARYYSVEDAAAILRMSAWTLYRNLDDVPHIRLGPYIRIPCEFLLLEPPRIRTRYLDLPAPRWFDQPYLPFDVKPERRWRNSKRLVSLDPFGSPRESRQS